MEFKDKALKVVEKAKQNGKTYNSKKELLLDVVAQLDSLDLKESLVTYLENGYIVPEIDTEVDPLAGELEDAVEVPPIAGYEDEPHDRQLVASTSTWKDGVIPYSIVSDSIIVWLLHIYSCKEGLLCALS